jgi:hypothetical protein
LFDSDYNAERPLRTLLLFFRGDRGCCSRS